MKSFFDGQKYFCPISNVYTKHAHKGHSCVSIRETYELIYKLSGSSDQIFPDRTLRLLPDHVYIIPKNHPTNEVMVDVPGDIINVVFTLLDCPDEAEFVPELLPLPPQNTIKPLFERILDIWEGHSPVKDFEAQSVLQSIFAGIYQIRSQERINSVPYKRLLPVLEWIEKEYRRADLDILELTKVCDVSGEYLRRLFRTYTGKTPMEYLRDIRLHHARELLFLEKMNVTETAYACGFNDPRYFARVFRKKYGVPPSQLGHGTVG